MTPHEFEALQTLDDVRSFVREGYQASGDPNSRWNRVLGIKQASA